MSLTLAGVLSSAGAILISLGLNLLNVILELINKLGFVAYWLVMMGLLWIDFTASVPYISGLFLGEEGGNLFGAVVSLFTIPLFGFSVSSFTLFALILFGGCIVILWKSKEGLTSVY